MIENWSPERDRQNMYRELARPWFRELRVRTGSYQGERVWPCAYLPENFTTADVYRINREWRWAVEGMNRRVNWVEFIPITRMEQLETWGEGEDNVVLSSLDRSAA